MDALSLTPSLPGLPDLRSRLINQVDFLEQLSRHACDCDARLSHPT